MEQQGSKTIRNCQFRYRCHMEWEDLEATASETIRRCGICEKNVHYCDSQEALAKAVLANLCVAIPAAAVGCYGAETTSQKANSNNPGALIGDIVSFGDA